MKEPRLYRVSSKARWKWGEGSGEINLEAVAKVRNR